MTEKRLRYPTVLFDWGDTVMRDDPANATPMVEWETIEVIDGIADVLAYLHASGRRIMLATSAAVSDESQIRGALQRSGLDHYFSKIFCFKNTGLSKGDAFYRHILDDLQIPASDTLMVGDSFEKDIQIPNALGMFGAWFNPDMDERPNDKLYIAVHTMRDLLSFFESLDTE